MAKTVYKDSAFGTAVFPHINKPDAKFKPDAPVFKVDLKLTGEAAALLKAAIDKAAEEAFAEFFSEGKPGAAITPKKKADWKVYRPYEEVEDPNTGQATGEVIFEFRQNEHIRLKDGTSKAITIGIYGPDGKTTYPDKLVRSGSELRVRYSIRPIAMQSLSKVGVRLDFASVQVRKWAEGNAGGFGAVEGAEPEPDAGFGSDNGPASGGGTSGDY